MAESMISTTNASDKNENNPSILLHGPYHASISNRPAPSLSSLSPKDVVVRIAFTGVCGSDVHFWQHGGMGLKVAASNPIVMGHEASGTVHAIGSDVTSLKTGHRVAIEPGVPCRTCKNCKVGRYNLCPKMRFAASPAEDGVEILPGTLAKYFVVPADFCFRLPEHVNMEEGVMVEPLAVACKSIRHVGVKPEDTVVVFGAGTVGLLCAAVAREVGAKKVVNVDINASKVEFARKWLGDDHNTFQPDSTMSPMETAKKIVEKYELGLGADIVVEATGAGPCILAGIYVLQRGGNYIQTGLGKEILEFPIMVVSEKELTIKGHFRYMSQDFEMAIGLLERRRINVKPLISKVFEFEQATAAWEATMRGQGIKNIIRGVQD